MSECVCESLCVYEYVLSLCEYECVYVCVCVCVRERERERERMCEYMPECGYVNVCVSLCV